MKTISENNKSKALIASIYGAIAAVLFVTAATIVGELAGEFKDWLKAVFFHHWIGKGALAIVVFAVVALFGYRMTRKDSDEEAAKDFYYLSLTAVVCTLILLGFIVYQAPSHL